MINKQAINDYIYNSGKYPFKGKTQILIYQDLSADKIVEDVLKDIYNSVMIVEYLDYQVAFCQRCNDVESLFATLSDDIGKQINVHEGIVINEVVSGFVVKTYLDHYLNSSIKTLNYSKVADMVSSYNNHDALFISCLKDLILKNIIQSQETIHLIKIFLNNNLNVLSTSKLLYMHRNSLLSKLESIEKQTTLNIQNFKDAYAMKVLLDYHESH